MGNLFSEKINLLDYFDVIQTPDDVKNVKPDPALFKNVINLLGIEPSEAIAFEDSLNGSKAAIAAGLKCVIVPNKVTQNIDFENFHIRLNSMKEKELSKVIDIIETLHV